MKVVIEWDVTKIPILFQCSVYYLDPKRIVFLLSRARQISKRQAVGSDSERLMVGSESEGQVVGPESERQVVSHYCLSLFLFF